MSGESYSDTCPRCGGLMSCYSGRKPHDTVSGYCLDCGWGYETQDYQMSLVEVNELREEAELKPLTQLAKPTKEWIESPYA